MNKIVKYTLIGLGVFVVLAVLFFVGYGVKAKSETKKMTPAETSHITDSIYAIRDNFVNLYLYKYYDRYIAFDAGNNIENLSQELAKLGVNPEHVVAIFLTHTDGDHVAGLSLFRYAQVYLSRDEEPLITGQTHRFMVFGNRLARGGYITLGNNDTITVLDQKIQGILTPGHTPGSMCYLLNGRFLFTGDALSLKNGRAEGFNEFFNMDSRAARKSIENLLNLPQVEYIFTGHHGYSHSYADAFREWAK
jgi:glyoxylase-like metal-dependent hydrolase (beta-lactamase superfamily II)